MLERRDALGGAWQDRWDSFYLNTPNFSFMLPGLTYDGPEPDAFLPRDAVIDLFRDYAQRIAAPVQLGTEATRIARAGSHFSVETARRRFTAENVVLANGAFQRPRIPAASAGLPGHVYQLHSHDYGNPQQLPDGAVLVVGTGQYGGQITEHLLAVGREVHLSVSSCPEAQPQVPRPGHLLLDRADPPARPCVRHQRTPSGAVPLPAARFMCNPLVSGNDGGHSIHLRELGRRGVRLHGRFEGADDGVLVSATTSPDVWRWWRPGSASA